MTFQTQLRIPGPTPLPERVVRSMSRPMIDHRGPEFAAILSEITAGAKRVFKTSNDLLLLTSSGTGGLESAVANLVSPGDEVVVALCGNFGERFAALASAYGADVVRLEVHLSIEESRFQADEAGLTPTDGGEVVDEVFFHVVARGE